jgi:hypothetical protein
VLDKFDKKGCEAIRRERSVRREPLDQIAKIEGSKTLRNCHFGKTPLIPYFYDFFF